MVKEEYDSHVASHNGLFELTSNANSVPPLGRRNCFRYIPFIGFDVTLHIGKYRFVKPPLGLMSWLVIVILKIGVIVVGIVLPFIVPITVALLVIIMVHHFSTIVLVVILRD